MRGLGGLGKNRFSSVPFVSRLSACLRMAALEISRSIPGNGKHISFGGQAAHWYEAVIFNVGKAAARGNPNAPETIFA
jgi:hypothetical protein